MDPEYFRTEDPATEDLITLTPGEWQELVSSIQNLVQANHSLLQTVSELIAQRSQTAAQTSSPSSPLPPPDPYDLITLNRLLAE